MGPHTSSLPPPCHFPRSLSSLSQNHLLQNWHWYAYPITNNSTRTWSDSPFPSLFISHLLWVFHNARTHPRQSYVSTQDVGYRLEGPTAIRSIIGRSIYAFTNSKFTWTVRGEKQWRVKPELTDSAYVSLAVTFLSNIIWHRPGIDRHCFSSS